MDGWMDQVLLPELAHAPREESLSGKEEAKGEGLIVHGTTTFYRSLCLIRHLSAHTSASPLSSDTRPVLPRPRTVRTYGSVHNKYATT